MITPNKNAREIQQSAASIQRRANAIILLAGDVTLTSQPDLSGVRAQLSLIKQSVEMIEGQLAMMGL